MPRIRDILQQQRKKKFVGRQNELNFFSTLLNQGSPAYHLIYIYGPGGQGKTTLLKQFADTCHERVPLLRIEKGKIKEGKLFWDLAGILRQIGLLPQMP